MFLSELGQPRADDSAEGEKRNYYLAMCALAHSPEQKNFDLLREETVTASLEEMNAPQERHRTMSALTCDRPPALSRISFTSLIVPRR